MSEKNDVSFGRGADPDKYTSHYFDDELLQKFEIHSYRNAAGILATSFPAQFDSLLEALRKFEISETMIRVPGGSKGPIAKYVDTLFSDNWRELRISADLHVKLLDAKKRSKTVHEYTKVGYLDGHRIDFVSDKVALDLEWNSKDQTYDRDLYAFSAFYEAGAIDLGIILTRGSSLDTNYFRSLGKVLKKDGLTEGKEDVYKKFGASTTWMGKLLYRLDAGRNGGCPVLAIGIRPECIRKT
ncbi:BglII/BstYI family type II restriction endonuclease [Litorimonas sp.]|uniref:BglII/BstYI family type II restriction endonuclease n=1 Tax=Litorimonas sp. TaxID=1892381 RepID=UPI003A887119